MKTRLIHGIMLGLALCLVCPVLAAEDLGDGRFEFSRAGYWSVPDSPRHVSSINTGWEFSLDEFKTVRKVNLPHSIDEGEIGFAASGGVNRRQPAWYRRVLSWKGGSARQFLHFEAIMGKCRIAVNGQKVAEHFGGYLPIHVEVTAVMADNEGIPKRYIREKVRFEVEGPAEIVGENPQETRWGEATVLVRMKERTTPEPITVRAGLVRQGKYVRQNGYVTFTPGSLSVRQGTVPFDDGRKIHDPVERQQL